MQAGVRYGIVGTVCAAVVGLVSVTSASAQQSQVERGKYLVTLGSCTDCHTPGYFFGKPEMARYLGGSEVGFEIPGLGVFHGPNLTPELGDRSRQLDDLLVTAMQTGKRPDGRELAPIMPWRAFANMTKDDVNRDCGVPEVHSGGEE